ncbi:MAG: pyridoxal phosphate-dependent aminotransferase [Alphaproteobacteria bacterium]
MALKVAGRASIAPFHVMEVMRAAAERERAGGDVLHLEVGQPSTPAPQGVLEAARRALVEDGLGYTLALGIEPLREAISGHYRDRYGVDVATRRVVVTTGSSGGFLLAFLAAFDSGDRVALAEPGYPCYRNILAALGLRPVALPVTGATNFQPTAAMVEALAPDVAGLIVASPSNPTGTMLEPGALAGLSTACRRRGIRLISDEIYHGITFGPAAETAAALDADNIVVNSFSKYFSMTGWRLGWLVLPDDLLKPVERLAQNLFISPPTLSQRAALAAFDCHEELDRNVQRYRANRDLLQGELPGAGFDDLSRAEGAFYVYAAVTRLANDSEALCATLLAETGVAITPGIDFDPERGRHWVRFSFSGATADVAEAARRLKAWRARR